MIGRPVDEPRTRRPGCGPRPAAPATPAGPTRPEAALIAAADQLHDGADIDDSGWAALAAGRTPAQLVDVLLPAGWHHAVSHAAPLPGSTGARRLRRLHVGP